MMNRAAVAGTLLLSLATVAHADDEAPVAAPAPQTATTTAQTLVVVTPNAPIVVTNGQQQNAPVAITPPGAAEDPAAQAASAAPINESWNNVSHINGTVVPVGERNAYLYNFKKNNIQSDPLAWMFGYYQVAASHALSQNIAVSVELSGWSHGSDTGYELAASLPIYFKRTFSGPFLEPGLVVHSDNNNYDNCYDCSYDSTYMAPPNHVWAGPEIMVGWSWMFDSGLNMSAAFGAAKRVSDNLNSSSDSPEPVGYFRVGYAF